MAKVTESPNCFIGEGSIFEGKFSVAGSIHINGKFQGEIKTDDHLLIGPQGKVKTDITAKKVTVAGVLIGNIMAQEEVTLLSGGMVLGNIKTPRLIVEPGALTCGELEITADKGPDVKQIILEAYGPETEAAFKAANRIRKQASNQSGEKNSKD